MKYLKCTKLLFWRRNLNEDSQAVKALKSLKQSDRDQLIMNVKMREKCFFMQKNKWFIF